jgi:hypothetical protein
MPALGVELTALLLLVALLLVVRTKRWQRAWELAKDDDAVRTIQRCAECRRPWTSGDERWRAHAEANAVALYCPLCAAALLD